MSLEIKQKDDQWQIGIAYETWTVPEKELKEVFSHLIDLKKKYGHQAEEVE